MKTIPVHAGRLASSMLLLLLLAVPFPSAGQAASFSVPEGESKVFRLPQPVSRVAVGDPDVADFLVIGPSELYLLGKKSGATNLVLWDRRGRSSSRTLQVTPNLTPVRELLAAVLPDERHIRIHAAGPAVVLSGSVSNGLAAATVTRLVQACLGGALPGGNPESILLAGSAAASGSAGSPAFSGSGQAPSAAVPPGGGAGSAAASSRAPRVVNLLRVRDPQQVRLEVHIAEVSKSYIETLGLGWSIGRGNNQGSLMTGFVSSATLSLLLDNVPGAAGGGDEPRTLVDVEAERKEGVVKILAEPTIVAMSGQEGYFLVGGKIFTPTVSSYGQTDYVERTYGVGLRFTPTVLDAGRIALTVAPEVSEPLKEAVTAGTSGTLPAFKTSYVSTSVQMNEGENLVIGGLLRDNLTEVVRAVPLLGDIPLLGALFRRTETDSETTELLVIVRPTLVKASGERPELPTDRFTPPTKEELFLEGKLQGGKGVQ